MTDTIEQPSEQIAALLGRATELKAELEKNQLATEGLAEVKTQFKDIREEISRLQAVENERAARAEQDILRSDLDSLLSERRPSKAAAVNRQPGIAPEQAADNFFATLAFAQSDRLAGGVKAQMAAEDRLHTVFGSRWMGVDPESKATVGDTDAAGGYLIPNNVVSQINYQATPGRAVVDLFTTINDVRGSAVDIPFEDANSTYSRAVVASFGSTKENSNFITNNYTATLYTLARIYDVGNQLLRQSQGAAEQMVRNALGRAFALGEDYYAIQGSGSSEPYGLLTAIGTTGTYVTTFSSPSASTIAGNWATGLSKAAGVVAQRGAIPDAAVFNSGDFWTNISSGADAAGFYVNPMGGGYDFNVTGAGVTGSGPWGIKVRHTPNMPTDSMVVGEYSTALFFRGQSYRVDTSDQAGTRWDKNQTGFRGEEEIAFDARPFVYTGRFQRITNILP